MKFEWETIHSNHNKNIGGSVTYRAKVIGGWIISNDVYTDDSNKRNITTSMIFVPDPNHEWEIKE